MAEWQHLVVGSNSNRKTAAAKAVTVVLKNKTETHVLHLTQHRTASLQGPLQSTHDGTDGEILFQPSAKYHKHLRIHYYVFFYFNG